MTIYDQGTLNRNGRALQLYLGVELVHDSAFPLAEHNDVVVHPVGDVGFLVLDETALPGAYPIEVPAPPQQLQHPEIDATAINDPQSHD